MAAQTQVAKSPFVTSHEKLNQRTTDARGRQWCQFKTPSLRSGCRITVRVVGGLRRILEKLLLMQFTLTSKVEKVEEKQHRRERPERSASWTQHAILTLRKRTEKQPMTTLPGSHIPNTTLTKGVWPWARRIAMKA